MTSPPRKRAKFVFIPAHITEPLDEWEVEYTEDQAVECLLDKVKSHFAKLKGPKTPEQVAAQREAFLQHLPAEQRASVPASLLETATGLGMVENVALLSNSAEHDFVGVNLYCDDEAGVLGAATNVRASEIAHRAGKQLDVKGDAFLARVRDDGNDVFERLDMTLADVSSSAEWVRQAEAQNRKKAEGESAASAMKRLGVSGINGASGGGGRGGAGSVLKASPKPKADTATQISELSASAAARDEGNAAFRKGQWKAAEKHYSRALELATAAKKEKGEQGEGNQDMDAADDASASESVSSAAAADDDAVAAANNRAAARLKLGDSAGALADAESVIRLRPSDVKARLRRAAALEALGGDDGGKRAGEDYKFVLRLEPRNTQALKGMEKIKGKKPAV